MQRKSVRRKVLSGTIVTMMLLSTFVPSAFAATTPQIDRQGNYKLNPEVSAKIGQEFMNQMPLTHGLDKAAQAKLAFQGKSANDKVQVIVKLSQPAAALKNSVTKDQIKQQRKLGKPTLNGTRSVGADRIDKNQVNSNLDQQTKSLTNLRSSGVKVEVKRQFTKAFNGYSATVSFGDLDKIAADNNVEAIYPDGKVQATDVNSINSMAAANLPGTGNSTLTGQGVVVAVIDTGVDYSHPDLLGPNGLLDRKFIGGYDFVNNDPDPYDDEGHGTHVAGIIAGSRDKNDPNVVGAAPDAKILAYKVLDSTGWGTDSQVIAGIEQAIYDGADIMNLSLGSANGFPDDPTAEAINNANSAGVLPVVSAGNSGPDYGDSMGTIGSPGTAMGALTVAAMDGNPAYPSINFTINYTEPAVVPASTPAPEGTDAKTAGQTTEPAPQTVSLPLDGFIMANNFTALTGQYEVVDCGLGNDPGAYLDAAGKSKVTGKVALIRRGIAPFVTKLSNAKNAGAVAAIIYNLSSQDVVYPVVLGDDPNLVPGIGVLKYSVGLDLQKKVLAAPPEAPVTLSFGASSVLDNPLKDTIASFSSRGLLPNYDLKPDIAAPGVNVKSLAPIQMSSNGMATMSGTSMAAPNVAGAAALLMQAQPNWLPDDYKVALMNTARDLSYDAVTQGAGLVQAASAVQTKDLIYQYRWGKIPSGNPTSAATYESGSVVFGAVGQDDPNRLVHWEMTGSNGPSAVTPVELWDVDPSTTENLVLTPGALYAMSGSRLAGSPLDSNLITLKADGNLITNDGYSVAVGDASGQSWTDINLQLQINDLNKLAPGDYQTVLNVSDSSTSAQVARIPVIFSVAVTDMFRNAVIEDPYISPFSGGRWYTGISFDMEQDIDGLKVEVYNEQDQFLGYNLLVNRANVAELQRYGYVLGNLNRGKYWIYFEGFVTTDPTNGSGWTLLADGKYRLKLSALKKGGNSAWSGDWVDCNNLESRFGTGPWVTVDSSAPMIKLTQPAFNHWKTKDQQILLTGTVEDPLFDQLTVNGETIDVQADTHTFSKTMPLQSGVQTEFELMATDLAGNVDHQFVVVEQVAGPVVPVTEVKLSDQALTLYQGEGKMLTATVAPDNATIRQVVWSSSDSNVVNVDRWGSVWAHGPGTATITATSTDNPTLSDSCTVTVKSSFNNVWGEPSFTVGEYNGLAGVFIGLSALMDAESHTALATNKIAGYQLVMNYDSQFVTVSDPINVAGNGIQMVVNTGNPSDYDPTQKQVLVAGASDQEFDASKLVFIPMVVKGSVYDITGIDLHFMNLSDKDGTHIGIEASSRQIRLGRGQVINANRPPDVTDAVGALQYLVGNPVRLAGADYQEVNTVNLTSIDSTVQEDGTTILGKSAIDHVIALLQYLAKLRDDYFNWINK